MYLFRNKLMYELRPAILLWAGLAAINEHMESAIMAASGFILVFCSAMISYARLEYRGYFKKRR